MNTPTGRPVIKFAHDTLTDKEGRFAIGKAFSWVAFYFLCYAFYGESTTRTIAWEDYVSFPVGVLVLFLPHKAVEIIKAIRGDSTMPPVTLDKAPEVK